MSHVETNVYVVVKETGRWNLNHRPKLNLLESALYVIHSAAELFRFP